MSPANNLSLEQQFQLVKYRKKLSILTKPRSRQYLEIILRYMLIKDNIIKFLIKHKKF
jgi:Phycobilisome degradation protein nblA